MFPHSRLAELERKYGTKANAQSAATQARGAATLSKGSLGKSTAKKSKGREPRSHESGSDSSPNPDSKPGATAPQAKKPRKTAEEKALDKAQDKARAAEAKAQRRAEREREKQEQKERALQDRLQSRERKGVPPTAALAEEVQALIDGRLEAGTSVALATVAKEFRKTAFGATAETRALPVAHTLTWRRRDRAVEAPETLSVRTAYVQPPNPFTAHVVRLAMVEDVVAAGPLQLARELVRAHPAHRLTLVVVGGILPSRAERDALTAELTKMALETRCHFRLAPSITAAVAVLYSLSAAIARGPYAPEDTTIDDGFAVLRKMRSAMKEVGLGVARVPDYTTDEGRKTYWFSVLATLHSLSFDIVCIITEAYRLF